MDGLKIQFVRVCSVEGCNERHIAEIRANEEFEGSKPYADDIFGGRGFFKLVCQKHFDEMNL